VIVVDTGPLLAAADADDDDHLACSALIERHAHELVIPAAVVVEVCWLMARTLEVTAEGEFLASIADEELRVEAQSLDDYHRASELVVTYADLGLDMVDAVVVAVAERLGTTRIATLDHRDFTVVRPRHADVFTLLP
jgi:hypothetical protein